MKYHFGIKLQWFSEGFVLGKFLLKSRGKKNSIEVIKLCAYPLSAKTYRLLHTYMFFYSITHG